MVTKLGSQLPTLPAAAAAAAPPASERSEKKKKPRRRAGFREQFLQQVRNVRHKGVMLASIINNIFCPLVLYLNPLLHIHF